MSIYGDAEAGGDSLASVAAAGSKEGGGPVVSIKTNLTDEQKKKWGAVLGCCALFLFIAWLANPSPPSCTPAEAAVVAAHRLPTTVDADGTVHFQADGKLVEREHDKVSLPLDYQVSFAITPGPTINPSWSNIIHVSATGGNCCNYGDRVPGVWFYPGKRQLHVIDGHGAEGGGNDECVIAEELVPGTTYQVRIDAHEKFVEVFFNNVMKCTEPRKDRRAFPAAQVYASDPWHPPADATLANLQLKPLEPFRGCTDASACNYDISASVDSGTCRRPGPTSDCNGNPIQGLGYGGQMSGPITLISRTRPMQIVRNAPLVHEARAQSGGLVNGVNTPPPPVIQTPGALHAIIPLPMDYTVALTVTPGPRIVEGWSSIVHFTATQTDCCAYGDRIPGVWFKPGSRNLHIRDGSDADGNSGCDPLDELLPNQQYQIEISVGQNGVQVKINGVSMCDRVATARRPWPHVHVFAGDPWYEPADAMISSLVVSPLVGHSGCMIDAACNRDFTATVPDPSRCQWQTSGRDCTNKPMVYTPAPSPCTVDAHGGGCGYHLEFGMLNAPQMIESFSPQGMGGAGGMGGLPHESGAHAVLNIPLDYQISFSITPTAQVQEGWSNIFHITATGQNCCNYGDRIPGVWFYPGGAARICFPGSCPGHRLHIVHGHHDSGNDDCSPEEELPSNVETLVEINIMQKHVEVKYNGRSVCTEPRGETQVFNAAHMYISDVWHPPALASIKNMFLNQMTPVLGCTKPAACNYNPDASHDDESCTMVSPGMDCNGQTVGAPDGSGVTQFIRGRQQLTKTQPQAVHAMVNLPLDYTVSFDLTPDQTIKEAWSNIIHFTATGNNCCEYGDRVPAVWFYPGSRQLHIIDGQPSNGNDECVIPEALTPGRTYHIDIHVGPTSVVASFDGVQKCTEPKTERQRLRNVHVYSSDPWHPPAGATIGDFKMTAN